MLEETMGDSASGKALSISPMWSFEGFGLTAVLMQGRCSLRIES
jgi:hypothetical protein